MITYTTEIRFSHIDPLTGETITTCIFGACSDSEENVAQTCVEWHEQNIG